MTFAYITIDFNHQGISKIDQQKLLKNLCSHLQYPQQFSRIKNQHHIHIMIHLINKYVKYLYDYIHSRVRFCLV
jgi:hypothetical protein